MTLQNYTDNSTGHRNLFQSARNTLFNVLTREVFMQTILNKFTNIRCANF